MDVIDLNRNDFLHNVSIACHYSFYGEVIRLSMQQFNSRDHIRYKYNQNHIFNNYTTSVIIGVKLQNHGTLNYRLITCNYVTYKLDTHHC